MCPFAPSSLATDFARMHLLAAVKGHSVRSRSAPPGRKQAEGQRDPAPSRARKRFYAKAAITCEDTRVRECDLIMCRVASPPHRPSDRRRAKGEDTSGRGSSVRFTSCVASRSWLFDSVRILSQAACVVGARQGCQRWRGITRSSRRQRSNEARPHHRSAQRRREAPSAPVLLERTRKPRGSGCPFDSRDGQKSVVRIFGSSIRGVARHRGPPAALATQALT